MIFTEIQTTADDNCCIYYLLFNIYYLLFIIQHLFFIIFLFIIYLFIYYLVQSVLGKITGVYYTELYVFTNAATSNAAITIWLYVFTNAAITIWLYVFINAAITIWLKVEIGITE